MKNESNKGLGMGAPAKNHQSYLGQAFLKLVSKVSQKYQCNFLIDTAVEGYVPKGEKKIRPDISFYAKADPKAEFYSDLLFVMEIVNNRGEKCSTGRILELFNREPTLTEGFVYNYERDTWARLSRKDGEVISEPKAYSLTFGFSIKSIVNVPSGGAVFHR